MKRNWVKFCEHAIQSDWKADAVGEKTNPDAGQPRFGSVPVVRCQATNQGWKFTRLNKEGKWVDYTRRAKSLSPVKPSCRSYGQFYGRGDLRRLVPEAAQQCPVASLPVRNKCDAHILEHMRCTCAACMDFACQWRRALKHKMRETAFGKAALENSKPKPHRWTYRIGGVTRPCPRMHKPTACPENVKPDGSGQGKKWPHVGSPRVNWWFGNYVPCDHSSDDCGDCDRSCNSCEHSEGEGDATDQCESSDEDHCNGNRSKLTTSRRQRNAGRGAENCEKTLSSSTRSNKRERDEGPLCISDLTTEEEERNSSSRQKGNMRKTCVADNRRPARARLWSNNAITSSGTNSKPQSPRRRYRSKSVAPVESLDSFEKVAMGGAMSRQAMTDHFRSVTCTDPSYKMLSTKDCMDGNSNDIKNHYLVKDKRMCKTKQPEPTPSFVTCIQEKPNNSENSSRRTKDRDLYQSSCNEFDKSANNGDKETNKSSGNPRGEKPRKSKRPKRKKSEDRNFMPEDLRRNVEKILQRDRCEAYPYQYEEFSREATLAKNNNMKMSGKRKKGGRKASPDTWKTPMDREYSDTSETTRLLRKYGVGDAFTNEAAFALGQGQFVQKDGQGFYFVNPELDPDRSTSRYSRSPQRPCARYKSSFIRNMGWGGSFDNEDVTFARGAEQTYGAWNSERNGERISNAWPEEEKLDDWDHEQQTESKERVRGREKTRKNQKRFEETENDQSPHYNTIKIVEGNSFWEQVWNKLSHSISPRDTRGKVSCGEEKRSEKPKRSESAKQKETDYECRDVSPNNSLIINHPSGRGHLPKDLIGEIADDKQSKHLKNESSGQQGRRQKVERSESSCRKCGQASKERQKMHKNKKSSTLIQKESMIVGDIEGSGARIKTSVKPFEEKQNNPKTKYARGHEPSPQTAEDTEKCDSAQEPTSPEPELPNNLDKDRVLFSPWEEDKLSDLVKSRDKRKPDRGVSYTIIRHENKRPHGDNSDIDSEDEDDEDFTTASTGGPDDDCHFARRRSASPERLRRESRQSLRSRKMPTRRGYASCRYDNLLPGDVDYIMAAGTSATSVASSLLSGYRGRVASKYNYLSDSSRKPNFLDETKNCLPAQSYNFSANKSTVGIKGGKAFRGVKPLGNTHLSYNNRSPGAASYRNRSPGKYGRGEKSYFSDCEWPYPLGFFSGPNSPTLKNSSKAQRKKCYPKSTSNTKSFYEAPKTKYEFRHNEKSYPPSRTEILSRNPSNKNNAKLSMRAYDSKTTTTNFRASMPVSVKSSAHDSPSRKKSGKSVDWVKRREEENRHEYTGASPRLDDKDEEGVTIYGPKEGSDVTVTESEPRGDNVLETINIRGPLKGSKNRRPLIEVNIFGPLNDDDEQSVSIRKTRGSQSTADDTEEIFSRVGADKSDEGRDDSSPEINTGEGEDNNVSGTSDSYLCDKCKDMDESTNHPHIPTKRDTIPMHMVRTVNIQGHKTYHSEAKKPPVAPSSANRGRYSKSKNKKMEVKFDENHSKSKPKTVSASQQTEIESQHLDKSAYLPSFSFITTDIPVPRAAGAHRSGKMEPQAIGTVSEKTRQIAETQNDRDKEKCVQKFNVGDSRFAFSGNDETRSTSFFAKDTKINNTGKVNLKSIGQDISQKANPKTLPSRPRSSSGCGKEVGNLAAATTREKTKPITSGITNPTSSGIKPRSRSLSASRSIVTTRSGSKIRSTCYPFYFFDNRENIKKVKTLEEQQTDNKRPSTLEGEDKSNLYGRNRGIITTWKTKKYPETIWHKYVKAERENLNWSNKFAEQRSLKEKETPQNTFVPKRKKTKTTIAQPSPAPIKDMKMAADTTKEKGQGEVDKKHPTNASTITTPEPTKSKAEKKIEKFKNPRCINIKDDTILNGWSMSSPLQDQCSNRSSLATMGSGSVDPKGNKKWGHATTELDWPIAGHRINYGDKLVSSHPTARMVDEPILASAKIKDHDFIAQPDGFSSSISEGDAQNVRRNVQSRARQSNTRKPSRSGEHAERDSTDTGYHRSQSRDRYHPPRSRKSCCGSSRMRKRSGQSSSSTSSTSSSDSPVYQRRRSAKRTTPSWGRRKLQKPRALSKTAANNEDIQLSTPAPPPSLRSNISSVQSSSVFFTPKIRAPLAKRGRNRYSTSQTKKKAKALQASYQPKSSKGFSEHNAVSNVHSSSSSEDVSHTKMPSQLQQPYYSSEERDDSDAFKAARRVLGEPRPISESHWEDQHASLMGDCSQENINNSWRRMHRIETKAKNLEGSMSRLKLNFGDIESRLDKVKVIQQEYMNKADEAVEMLRGRRGRSRSRRRQKPRNKSRNNIIPSASDDVDHGAKNTPAEMKIDDQTTKKAQAKVLGPYAKNKRQDTFICAKPSAEGNSKHTQLVDEKDTVPGVVDLMASGDHSKGISEDLSLEENKAGKTFGKLQLLQDINQYLEFQSSRNMSKSRSRSNESRVVKSKRCRRRDNENPANTVAHIDAGCQHKKGGYIKEGLEMNIPLHGEPSKQNVGFKQSYRRRISSNRTSHTSRGCSLTKDKSSNNSNRQQRSWSSILAAYQTWNKRTHSAHSDTESSWSDQEDSVNSSQEDGVTSKDQCTLGLKTKIVSDRQANNTDGQNDKRNKSDEMRQDAKKVVPRSKQVNVEKIKIDSRKKLNSEKRCSCPKYSQDIINKLSDLLQNILIKTPGKKNGKDSKVFSNTKKSLSKVYARPAQPSASSNKVKTKSKIPKMLKNRSEILKELARYRRAYEDSVYAQKLGLRSRSTTPCSRRRRSSSVPGKSGRKPSTYTQLYHDRVRYERSPSRHRPTTASGIPRLELMDRDCLNMRPVDNFRQSCPNGCSAGNCLEGEIPTCTHGQGVKGYSNTKDQIRKINSNPHPTRELHVHLPQDVWFPESFSPQSSQTQIYNRRNQRHASSKTKLVSNGISANKNNKTGNSRPRRCSRPRWNSSKTRLMNLVGLRNFDEAQANSTTFDLNESNELNYTLSSPPPPPSSPINFSQNEQNQDFQKKCHDRIYNYDPSDESSKSYSPGISTITRPQTLDQKDFEDPISAHHTTKDEVGCNTPTHAIQNRQSPDVISARRLEKPECVKGKTLHIKQSNCHFNCIHERCNQEIRGGLYDHTRHNLHELTPVNCLEKEAKHCRCCNQPPSQHHSYTFSNIDRNILPRSSTPSHQSQYLQEKHAHRNSFHGSTQREHSFVSDFMRSIENEVGIEVKKRKEHSLTLRSLAPIYLEQENALSHDSRAVPRTNEDYKDINHSALHENECQTPQNLALITDHFLEDSPDAQENWTQKYPSTNDRGLHGSLDRLTHDLRDNPISDTDDGGLSGSTNRVRFAEPIAHVAELPEAVCDYTSGRWRKVAQPQALRAPFRNNLSKEIKKEKDPWETTRRVLDFLDKNGGTSTADYETNKSSKLTKLDTLPPPRPESVDGASLGRRYGHTDLTRLSDVPPSPSRLLSARQQRAPLNVLSSLRRSDDSGCETGYDLDTDSPHF